MRLPRDALHVTLLTITCVVTGSARSSQPMGTTEPYGVVLYGADWCAPCRIEKARLGEMERAAAPLPVSLHWFSTSAEVASMLADLGVAMLPVAIAYDSHGRICGRRQGLLGTEQLRSWAHHCERTRS